jgi:hypothetical protein
VNIDSPYRPRPIRFLELWQMGDWKMKAYGIAYRRRHPRPELVEAARQRTTELLADLSVSDRCYGMGFVGIHDGKGANLVFIDWWADENELHHHVYVSPAEAPGQLVDKTHTGLAACTWDLKVIGFERDAWTETVLKQPDQPDLAGYLTRRINADV